MYVLRADGVLPKTTGRLRSVQWYSTRASATEHNLSGITVLECLRQRTANLNIDRGCGTGTGRAAE